VYYGTGCFDQQPKHLGYVSVAKRSQSRRSFPGAGSAVLAAATLVGLTANAQQREDTRKAEADHSSSDPAQENKPLLAENPNSNMPPPTDHGDVGAIWFSFDLVHKRVQEGGWTHQVTQREFPSVQGYRGGQHAAHGWKLSRVALAHGR
jgi:oxalate decarboxylase